MAIQWQSSGNPVAIQWQSSDERERFLRARPLGVFGTGNGDDVVYLSDRHSKRFALVLRDLISLTNNSRLLPHPPNFGCIAAAGLFAGCCLRGWCAIAVPVAAMVLSDNVGDLFRLHGMGFYSPAMMAVVYASIAISVLIGSTLRDSRSLPRLLTVPLAMSTLFFLITNGAVWASGMYSYDFVGIVKC